LKLETLKKAVACQNKQSKQLSKMSWLQKYKYFELGRRINYLYTLLFFLSLRQKIKKEVQENYVTKTKEQILESIVEYDRHGIIEFEGQYIFKSDLEPLIESYIQKQIDKIESYTLKLAL
jgi:mannosyltransferase OCH1-like enzyme